MKFEHETGAIIAIDGSLISMFDGEPGHVDFPDEMIQKIHKLNPGYIQRFTHTHPPGMGRPSAQDNIMMTNLAHAMYPFPVRLGIIIPDKYPDTKAHYFSELVYQWVLEPKEIWQAKKMMQNDIKRGIVFEHIKSRMFLYQSPSDSWEDWIIERSYNHV